MATPLEIKKIKAELLRVQAAEAEFEVRIAEYEENIGRLQEQVEIQKNKRIELTQKIKEIELGN